MSSEIVIRVRGVGKAYSVFDKPYQRLLQLLSPSRARRSDDFQALTDVSIDVRRGEAVGIIGRNGSGKSTLLQIVCGTLQPSAGTVEVNGRVAALLRAQSLFAFAQRSPRAAAVAAARAASPLVACCMRRGARPGEARGAPQSLL